MHVVITGANRGIGREMASQLNAAGHVVTGTARDGSSDVALDVTDPDQQARFAAHLGDRPIDLLVCNAGVYLDKGLALEDYTAEIWSQSLAANVTGVFLTIQALLPNLRLGTTPKIAIISSQMASHARAPGGSYAYRASKAAVLNLGRNLSTDLRPEGIAVGIYHPGWVRTEMGGEEGDISVAESASGLIREFDILSLEITGCFHTWDGRIHAY
ncbi:SDR family oxidoreductase [Pseudophaeobacter arcticus]|uniref:SDR family oxidoreductase n=1 Tax=Pseudophaeobacter arcticus TaxID=385492 RepID=UPI000424D714|nr:SDR family oxidoreductase [Pseudophaeobacter arcticus]